MTPNAPYTMFRARLFLPSNIILLINWCTSTLLYIGSGPGPPLAALTLRAITQPPSLLRPLGAVLRTPLTAISDSGRIQRSAHDMVAHAGQIFHTTAPNQYDRVFLEVVPFTGDVPGHLNTVRQAHPSHFAQSSVRLLQIGRAS